MGTEIDVSWLWLTLILPVIIGIFKHEIATFIGDYSTYRNRSFDQDGDPGTGEDCYLQCDATGDFNKITVAEYRFGLAPSKRKVITHQTAPSGDLDKVIVVPYSYSKWSSMVKGSLPRERTLNKRNYI